jgi:hypothetical protein
MTAGNLLPFKITSRGHNQSSDGLQLWKIWRHPVSVIEETLALRYAMEAAE